MKRMLQLIVLLGLTSGIVHAQTLAKDISLTVNDGAGGTQELRFGLAPTATDGIDAALDESELPPVPPAGVFDARFIGADIGMPQLGQGTHKDYRTGTAGFTGTHTHELNYQVGSGTAITIRWNLPSGVTGLLQDLLGGVVVNQKMQATGSLEVSNPSVLNKLKMVMTYSVNSVEQLSGEIPNEFRLGQNYPNPFNPGTTIEFHLPKPAVVTLKIYNVTGVEVMTLLSNEKLNAGAHKFSWEASELASGIYLYQLVTPEFSQTQKMTVLK